MIIKILSLFMFRTFLSLMLLLSWAHASGRPNKEIRDMSRVCLDCHEELDCCNEMGESIKETAHNHLTNACASCHHPKGHLDDPSPENITIPSRESDADLLVTCASCHDPHLQLDQVGFDPHQAQGMNCLSCHDVHRPNSRLLLDDSGDFCGKCHTGIVREFERRSAHPLEADVMTCWSCHDFVGAEPNLSYGSSETCLNCHPEQAGPYRYEHEALSSFTTEGSGCVSCHSPHGSSNERLLNQPGSGLCQQCHSVPRHVTVHQGAFADIGCMNCHVEIHGSYEDKNFLDPMIGSNFGDGPNGCYCHTGGN